jgi:hypothetical protein
MRAAATPLRHAKTRDNTQAEAEAEAEADRSPYPTPSVSTVQPPPVPPPSGEGGSPSDPMGAGYGADGAEALFRVLAATPYRAKVRNRRSARRAEKTLVGTRGAWVALRVFDEPPPAPEP